jgi:hypothetical protein
MITNKDIRVENGNLVLNGDKYPLDGQSPEAIMQIVEDNSDSTPTAESNVPVKSAGIKSYVDTLLSNKAIVVKATTSDTKNFTIPLSVWTDAGFTGSNHTALFCGGYNGRISAGFLGTSGSAVSAVKLGDNTVAATIEDDNIKLAFNDTVYTDLRLILFN